MSIQKSSYTHQHTPLPHHHHTQKRPPCQTHFPLNLLLPIQALIPVRVFRGHLLRSVDRNTCRRVIVSGNILLQLLGQGQVEDHADESRDGETSLHDEDDGVEEALEGAVSPIVAEDVGEVRGDEGGAVTEGETGGKDEAVAASEDDTAGDDSHTGDGDGGEEEGCHATEDGRGDGDEGGGELGKDTHDDEEHAAGEASLAVGAAGEGNDTVVLGKDTHGGDGHESGEQATETVSEDATLDSRFVEAARDFELGDIASGRDVTDGFGCADDVYCHDREHQGAVDRQGEGVDPDEGGSGG